MSNKIIVPQGDDATVTANIKDAAGANLNLTGATVEFIVYDADTVLFTKNATIVGAATNGNISVPIDDDDTDDLRGLYIYKIKVTDSGGNISTVRVENFLVVTNQDMVNKENVRLLISDTSASSPLLTDAQIYYYLFEEDDIYLAASKAALGLSARYAGYADISVEGVRTSYSQKATGYANLADRLANQSIGTDIPSPGISGISNSDMRSQRSGNDRVREQFYMDRFDNPTGWIPEEEGGLV